MRLTLGLAGRCCSCCRRFDGNMVVENYAGRCDDCAAQLDAQRGAGVNDHARRAKAALYRFLRRHGPGRRGVAR